ncbi:MAG: alpha-glucosidase C-terminal domain-containing protein, partial [Anaerolineales bacterium]
DPDCRKSFPWDESRWDKDLLEYTKDVIALRRKNVALRRGNFTRLWSADGVYAFSRALHGQTRIVALNTSESPQQAEVRFEAKKNPKAIFGQASDVSVQDGRVRFTIPARSGVVLR